MNPEKSLVILCLLCVFACHPGSDRQTATVELHTHETSDAELTVADSLFLLGHEYQNRNKTDSALVMHEKALAIREKFLKQDLKLLDSYVAISRFYLDEFKYETAIKYLEKGRMISDFADTPPDVLIDLYFKLADCKLNLRDIPTATSLIKKNIELINLHDPNNHAALGKAYHRFSGLLYYDKKHAEGIQFSERAIQLESGNHAVVAKYYATIGMHYKALNKNELALHYFNRAIAQDLKWAGPESDEIAKRFLQKGFIFFDLENYDSARYYLSKNLTIRKRVYGDKHVNTFGAKYSLGNFFFRSEQFDSAAHYYHQSLISLIKNFKENSLRINPKPSADEVNTDLVIGLVGKASALKKMAEADAQNPDLLERSLNTYFLADSIFHSFTTNFIEDDPQLMQLESQYIPYETLAEIAFTLFESKKNSDYVEKALTAMERSRAVLLQSALKRSEAYARASLSDEFGKEENRLISTRQSLLQQLIKVNPSSNYSDSLYQKLFETENQHHQLVMKIHAINPEYFALRFQDEQVSLQSIMHFLQKKNSVLFEYLWGEKNLYVIMIDPDSVSIRKVPIEKIHAALNIVLTELKAGTQNIFDKERFDRFCRNSKLLFDYLLGDLLPTQKQPLIIAADGPLASFPFEVLLTQDVDKGEVDYRLPYLLHDHAISYAFSSGLLVKQSDRQRSGKKLLALGYAGNGRATQRDGFSNLPGTEKEVLAIRSARKNDADRYYLETEVSESTFKEQASEFDIIHLAIHGLGDTLNALESRLIFRSENDLKNDGQLYAHELYDLDLSKLNLAVLSACESGIGKHQIGEGVMSIARGFAYAGCPSQVISLWKIDDATTAEIMAGFYKKLSDSEPVDVSLKEAKLGYLSGADELNSHPTFWAAFLMLGDNRSFDAETNSVWYWAIAGALTVILITAFVLRERKENAF